MLSHRQIKHDFRGVPAHGAHHYAIRNTVQASLLDAPDSALQLVPWLLLLSGSSLSCARDTAGLYAEL